MELHGQDIHMDEARMDASKLIILVKTFSPHLRRTPIQVIFWGTNFAAFSTKKKKKWEKLGIF
jgi:hypothetical protein